MRKNRTSTTAIPPELMAWAKEAYGYNDEGLPCSDAQVIVKTMQAAALCQGVVIEVPPGRIAKGAAKLRPPKQRRGRKLTGQDVLAIVADYRAWEADLKPDKGSSTKQMEAIADAHQVSFSTVYYILSGRLWGWLTGIQSKPKKEAAHV